MVSKNEVLQLQIDAIAEMSREENKGRQEMLRLWEKTIKQLSDRDEDFSKLGKVSVHQAVVKFKEPVF